jgi:hypothetical protein
MTAEEITAALRPLGEGLEHDGYALAVAVRDAGVALRIVAGPEACEECLVPKELMAALATQALADAGLSPGRLEIVYPGE